MRPFTLPRSALLSIACLAAGCFPADPAPRSPGTGGAPPHHGGPAPGVGHSQQPEIPHQGTEPLTPDGHTDNNGGHSVTSGPAPVEQPPADPMRRLEAEIVVAMNQLRANPKEFVDELQTYRSYYDSNGYINYPGDDVPVVSNEGVGAVDEAISAARKASPAPQMSVSAGLSRAAREHAAEIGAAGTIDHVNARGEQPHHRMERYGVISGYSGENIGTGDAGGLNMVIGLFVDDGVPSRGHRDNLLTKAFRKVGVGCAKHIHWEIVCVIDTAEGYREN